MMKCGNTIFSDYDGAVLTAYDSEFGELPEDTYSIDGYQVTFKNAGEYYLVASGTEEVVLVPSVVKVTVTKNEENQKQYLSSLEIFPLTLGKFQLFEPGKYEYVYELPSSFSKRFQFYGTLSEAAPENSNVTLTYYDTKGKLTTKKFLKKIRRNILSVRHQCSICWPVSCQMYRFCRCGWRYAELYHNDAAYTGNSIGFVNRCEWRNIDRSRRNILCIRKSK